MRVIPTLGKLKKEDHEFKACLGYIAKSVSKRQTEKHPPHPKAV
jgi:hypothetical protein